LCTYLPKTETPSTNLPGDIGRSTSLTTGVQCAHGVRTPTVARLDAEMHGAGRSSTQRESRCRDGIQLPPLVTRDSCRGSTNEGATRNSRRRPAPGMRAMRDERVALAGAKRKTRTNKVRKVVARPSKTCVRGVLPTSRKSPVPQFPAREGQDDGRRRARESAIGNARDVPFRFQVSARRRLSRIPVLVDAYCNYVPTMQVPPLYDPSGEWIRLGG
jgi:hypothetical protein